MLLASNCTTSNSMSEIFTSPAFLRPAESVAVPICSHATASAIAAMGKLARRTRFLRLTVPQAGGASGGGPGGREARHLEAAAVGKAARGNQFLIPHFVLHPAHQR